jgi:hypothetical protein
MSNSPAQPSSHEKFDRAIGLVSGLLGIVSFSRDYPELGFLLLIIFGAVIFLVYRNDFVRIDSIQVNSRSEKFGLIFRELIIKKGGFIFAALGIVVLSLAVHFLYREAFFLVKNGWVEEAGVKYEFGMGRIRLASQDYDKRLVDLLEKINPVIGFEQTYTSAGEIYLGTLSFETGDIDVGDDLNPDANIRVEVTGFDPNNKYVDPIGNFGPNKDESGYKKFLINDGYTLFVAFNDCPVNPECYVRIHVILQESWPRFYPVKATLFFSYLDNGSSRFGGLVAP